MPLIDDDIIPLDRLTGAVCTISYEHHEIHDGERFVAQYFATVASGGFCDLQITMPAGVYAHPTFMIYASAEADFGIYEAPTTSGGTAVTTLNRSRASSKTSTATVVHSPIESAVGTQLLYVPVSGSKLSAGVSDPVEWILAPGTKYLVRGASLENGCRIAVIADWYQKASA